MKEYTVFWSVDIDADSPKEAAVQALRIQRDSNSIATVFDVYDGCETTRVDLRDEP